MGKSYNLMSKSDMRRLERDIVRDMKSIAKDTVTHDGVEVDCPQCGAAFNAREGTARCPRCGETINVTFDWSNF